MELDQLIACYAFQRGLFGFERYYWKLLLSPLLDALLFANAALQHSEPSTNNMKPWEGIVVSLLTCSPTNTCAFQTGFESYYWKLLLCHPLDALFFANAVLQHSEPSTNYISDMKPWEGTVTDLYSHKHLYRVPSTKLDFSYLTIHYFCANATLQYNSFSTNFLSEMELWEAIVSDV